MIDKIVQSTDEAVADVNDGSHVLVGGFGEAGSPTELLHALVRKGSRNLTLIANNAGNGEVGIAALLAAGQVSRVVCSYPRGSNSHVFEELYASGKISLELNPQGTLAERIRAGGSGVGAFFTPTGAGTALAAGKETREIGGRPQVLEFALRANVAIIKAEAADRWGNLTFRKAARNFSPVMCMAADLVVVQARQIVELGGLDPEVIVTPGIFVDRVVHVPEPANEGGLKTTGVSS